MTNFVKSDIITSIVKGSSFQPAGWIRLRQNDKAIYPHTYEMCKTFISTVCGIDRSLFFLLREHRIEDKNRKVERYGNS